MASILILDEEADSCMMLKRLLEPSTHRLWAFVNPSEALECAAARKPDLVLVSVTSRHGTNLAILAELKSVCPGLKIIFLGDYVPDERLQALSADAFLIKPVDIDTVERKVRELLRCRSCDFSSDRTEACILTESSTK